MSKQDMKNQESSIEVPFDVKKITADDINIEGIKGMEDIINTSLGISITSTQSNNVQSAYNRSLKIFALHILKHLSKDIFYEEPDFSSIKSNEAIPDYGSCQECEIPILTKDLSRSLVLNVCGDVIYQTCANKVNNHGVLPCSYSMVDDNDLFLPLEEVSNNSNESRKRTSVEDTFSRKKVRTKKRLKGASPMLKKFIKELKTLSSSIKDNLKSQLEVPGSFTDLYEVIIQTERRTVTNNQEIIRAYYSFGKEFENRLAFYKITYSERRAQRKLNDEIGE